MNLRRKRWVLMNSGVWRGHIRNISGNPVTLENALGLQTLEILGNSIQNGTPSPGNPIDVFGVGEKTNNYYIINDRADTQYDITVNGSSISQYYVLNGISTRVGNVFLEKNINFDIAPGETITLVAEIIEGNILYPENAVVYISLSNSTNTKYIRNTAIAKPGKGIILLSTGQLPETENGYNILVQMLNNTGITFNDVKLRIRIYKGKYTADTLPSYEPYGYKIPVSVEGWNLFDAEGIVNSTDDTSLKMTTYQNKNCLSWIDGSSTRNQRNMQGYFKENTQYTFSFTGYSEKTISIYISYTDGTYSSFVIACNGAWNHQIKTSAYGKTIDYWRGWYNYDKRVYIDLAQSQIVEGTYTAETMPSYEPYKEPQTINVYTPQVLHGLGDVNDTVTIDFDNRKAEFVQNIIQDVFNSGWGGYSQTGNICRAHHTTTPQRRVSPVGIIDVASDIFIATTASLLNNAVYQIAGNTNTSVINVTLDANALVSADIDGFNTFMTEHPATIYYVLKSPVTTDISNLQDWDNMPQLTGTITLTASGTAEPKLNVTYYSIIKE